jgi:hypothetical protein
MVLLKMSFFCTRITKTQKYVEELKMEQSPNALNLKGEKPADNRPNLHRLVPTLNARNLMATEFPDVPWVVPGLIPPGLTLIASRPKLGKSWLCLGLGLGVATGATVLGQIEVPRRDVLYIALEDTERGLKNRLGMILQGAQPPEQYHFALRWPQLDGAGAKDLRNWIKEHPETGLIMIDTFARIRGFKGGAYGSDYKEIAELKAIADDHKIAILLVHHLRKAEAKDVMDMVSGSTGLTGAADTIGVLQRSRSSNDATLFLSGREVEDQGLAMEFDSGQGWIIVGNADEYQLTVERQQIVDLLKQEGGTMKLGEIAGVLGKKKPNVTNLLNSLIEQGLMEKVGHGKYQLKSVAKGDESPSSELSAEGVNQPEDSGDGVYDRDIKALDLMADAILNG